MNSPKRHRNRWTPRLSEDDKFIYFLFISVFLISNSECNLTVSWHLPSLVSFQRLAHLHTRDHQYHCMSTHQSKFSYQGRPYFFTSLLLGNNDPCFFFVFLWAEALTDEVPVNGDFIGIILYDSISLYQSEASFTDYYGRCRFFWSKVLLCSLIWLWYWCITPNTFQLPGGIKVSNSL